MISTPHTHRRQQPRKRSNPQRTLELQEILQGLRLVLEMEPDHIDGAIDLLDEAIDSDQRRTKSYSLRRSQSLSPE